MVKLNVDVNLEGITSAYIESPFDKAKIVLNENGYRIISLEENALLRIREGKDSFVSQNGNWIRESFVYIPKNGVYLVRNSPVLDETERATNDHRKENEFCIDNEQIEKALEDSVLIPYKTKAIPTDSFGDEDITNFAFSEQAKAYGEFLNSVGIEEMPIRLVVETYVNKQNKAFARQLWFDYIKCKSGLGGGMVLYYDVGVRGVRDAEANSFYFE